MKMTKETKQKSRGKTFVGLAPKVEDSFKIKKRRKEKKHASIEIRPIYVLNSSLEQVSMFLDKSFTNLSNGSVYFLIISLAISTKLSYNSLVS